MFKKIFVALSLIASLPSLSDNAELAKDYLTKANQFADKCSSATSQNLKSFEQQNIEKLNKKIVRKLNLEKNSRTENIFYKIFTNYMNKITNLDDSIKKMKKDIDEEFSKEKANINAVYENLNVINKLSKYCVGINNYLDNFIKYLKTNKAKKTLIKDFKIDASQIITDGVIDHSKIRDSIAQSLLSS